MTTSGDSFHRTGAFRTLTAALISSCLLAGAFVAPAQANQPPADEFVTERTYFRGRIANRPVRLEGLIIRRADLKGRLPVALITHGKSASLVDMLDSNADDYSGSARDLARRGWLSVVVMRRGFGQSDGPVSVSITCDSKTFSDFFAADADDLQMALDAVTTRTDADPSRAIAVGVSAGGASVMALAARNPKNLHGVVNISGGLRTLECPKEDALVSAFRDFGATSRIPTLWIYAKNDSFFGPKLVENMQSAYLDGGGDVKLVMYDSYGRDGHNLFIEAKGRLKWLMEVDGFLRAQGLPTARRDSIADLMKLLRLGDNSRAFLEQYLAAPTYKAMAQTPDGRSHATQYGAPSLEIARTAVLDYCRAQFKTAQPCRIVMENDTWMGPAPVGVSQREVVTR